jgi:hypothetical protein
MIWKQTNPCFTNRMDSGRKTIDYIHISSKSTPEIVHFGQLWPKLLPDCSVPNHQKGPSMPNLRDRGFEWFSHTPRPWTTNAIINEQIYWLGDSEEMNIHIPRRMRERASPHVIHSQIASGNSARRLCTNGKTKNAYPNPTFLVREDWFCNRFRCRKYRGTGDYRIHQEQIGSETEDCKCPFKKTAESKTIHP